MQQIQKRPFVYVLVEATQDERASHAVDHGRVETDGHDCQLSHGPRWLCRQQHGHEDRERNKHRNPEEQQPNAGHPWRQGHSRAVYAETKPRGK